MNMPEVKCFFCLETGQVCKVPPGDQRLAEFQRERDRYVAIEAIPSRIQYQWLDEFIKTVDDDALQTRLVAAINGKGAFRRFKDILLTLPDERRRWFEFRDLMMRNRIIDWVREQGIEAENEPQWKSEQQEPAGNRANLPKHLEQLRDFLIEWAETKSENDLKQPAVLEELSQSIGERFRVKPKNV